ncbi:hypothetical protein ECC02_004865 [Trypanosoma cruzi]|uniref:Uncharacterized protein n=1 Tax=Trypanosoma cruzi TaxID=5693 RepID=A0A7J6Y5T2_TRYCR|nr:hypothetical protein ECC02_004865 [Trypanosoma cruzi]
MTVTDIQSSRSLHLKKKKKPECGRRKKNILLFVYFTKPIAKTKTKGENHQMKIDHQQSHQHSRSFSETHARTDGLRHSLAGRRAAATLLGDRSHDGGERHVARHARLHALQHAEGLLVHVHAVLDGLVNMRHLRYVVHAALALLLLQLQRDATDGTAGQALHDVCRVPGNLVLQLFGAGDGDVHDNAFVLVEVLVQLREILLHQLLRRALHCLRADLAHACSVRSSLGFSKSSKQKGEKKKKRKGRLSHSTSHQTAGTGKDTTTTRKGRVKPPLIFSLFYVR